MRLLLSLILAVTLLVSGCTSLTDCENVAQHEAILLIDVTDKQLFANIKDDLNANLPTFMEKSGLGTINVCQSFTLTMAPISAKEGLQASSETISISRKGQSYQAEKSQASPAPLVRLMKNKLSEFDSMTDDAAVTSGSSIANVLVKALSNTTIEAETTVIVFSDMVENNQYLNMYRDVPSTDNSSEATRQLIDPVVLQEFQTLQKQGLDANIIIVFKESPNSNINSKQREVKGFWVALLNELDLHNVEFMDNLTNVN